MEHLFELLKKVSAGEITLTVALIVICCSMAYFFYKEIKGLYEAHKVDIQKCHDDCEVRYTKMYETYKDDNDKITKQMFETLGKNIESSTKLAEAVRDLSSKL